MLGIDYRREWVQAESPTLFAIILNVGRDKRRKNRMIPRFEA